MAKLNNANGDNWSLSDSGSQINLTYNGMSVYVEKKDLDVIVMIMQKMNDG